MIDVVAVSFNNTIDYVSCSDLSLKRGNFVIIECDNGVQMARAINDSYKEKEENLALPLKGVLRIATEDDLKKADGNQKIADKALLDARKFSADLLLNMNFIGAFYNFDRSQLLFYFLETWLKSWLKNIKLVLSLGKLEFVIKLKKLVA